MQRIFKVEADRKKARIDMPQIFNQFSNVLVQRITSNHTEDIKNSHYFNNKNVCSYESIGCKFLHTKSAKCRYVDCKNSLCQFSHSKVIEVDPKSEFEDSDTDVNPNENQCHICRKQLLSKNDPLNHAKNQHEAYYQGMLDVAASITNFDDLIDPGCLIGP